ncbi:VOC family protein [Virgibacillus subterraneus]|nr:VOC family protein [Virgibacillus subterraneus]
MKLLQIRLLVKDFRKSVSFYKNHLELPISLYEEEMEYALFETGETKIELLPRNVMAEGVGEEHKPVDAETQSSFLFQFKVEDVDKSYSNFREKNIMFVNPPHDRTDWGARVAHFRDPDGNLIEIYRMLGRDK